MCPRSLQSTQFWTDLAKDLEDPEFRREDAASQFASPLIDLLMNALDEAREAARLSEAGLAGAIGAEPAIVRRLSWSGHGNLAFGKFAEVAAALGMRVTLDSLPPSEREQVTAPLLEGRSAELRGLARQVTSMRRGGAAVPA